MRTNIVSLLTEYDSDYGGGAGSKETYTYECLCGKGAIKEIHRIEVDYEGCSTEECVTYIQCPRCAANYKLDPQKGDWNWELIERE